ncbi:uncharacterized protein EHS24_000475 [Apiotrichum porosum]|uniref:DASH complex subunit DAD4 n=1 Tax=Apiotrichum porosum TaxID=105984 RepID=A0A427YA22_9TREE|nr:uncharacterized protein EHS24_000475 [Apiotrichum porosum]RSH87953.1 hypothetical protein EHS24_000475 [Apiotrichum porosum]
MDGFSQMQNPHEAEQNVLLERIIRNVDKCNEAMVEMNQCLRDFLESAAAVGTAAQLFENYGEITERYMTTTKMMPKPQ